MKNRNAIGMWSWSLSIAIYFFYSLVQRTKNQKSRKKYSVDKISNFCCMFDTYFLLIFKHIFQVYCAFEFSIARWCAVKQKKSELFCCTCKNADTIYHGFTFLFIFRAYWIHTHHTYSHNLCNFVACMVKWFRFSSGAFSLIEQHITMWKLYLSEKTPRIANAKKNEHW